MAYTSSQVVQAVPTGIQSALVFISSTTIVNGSATQINNCFSATYDNYVIKFTNLTGPSFGTQIQGRLGTSGTPDTSSVYVNGSTAWGGFGGQMALMNFPNNAGASVSFGFNLYGPNMANKTWGATEYIYYDSATELRGHYVNTSTQYTDFTLVNTTITGGTIKIYGLQN